MFGFRTLFTILAPHDCLLCGSEGSLLCEPCLLTALPLYRPCCFVCRKPSQTIAVCKTCHKFVPLRNVWVGTEYTGVIKRLVHCYKFERAQDAAGLLATIMARVLPSQGTGMGIVCVPTATKRVRERGYDHARLLARALAKQTGLPYQNVLRRVGQTRQVGANRKDRLRQLEYAYVIRSPVAIRNKHILLVDDILTTGSTLSTVARVLLEAGAKSVDAMVVAQKQ